MSKIVPYFLYIYYFSLCPSKSYDFIKNIKEVKNILDILDILDNRTKK